MLSAGARNEDLTVGAGLLPVGVHCKELGTDTHTVVFWCVSNAKMLHFACNNNFEGDHQAFSWICTLLSNITLLDGKNQSLYSHRFGHFFRLFLGLARGCLLCGPEVRQYFPPFSFFLSFFFCLWVEVWTLLIFEPQIRSIFQLCNTVPGFSEWHC